MRKINYSEFDDIEDILACWRSIFARFPLSSFYLASSDLDAIILAALINAYKNDDLCFYEYDYFFNEELFDKSSKCPDTYWTVLNRFTGKVGGEIEFLRKAAISIFPESATIEILEHNAIFIRDYATIAFAGDKNLNDLFDIMYQHIVNAKNYLFFPYLYSDDSRRSFEVNHGLFYAFILSDNMVNVIDDIHKKLQEVMKSYFR